MSQTQAVTAVRLINLDDDATRLILDDVAAFEARHHASAGSSQLLVRQTAEQFRRYFGPQGASARWGGYLAVDGQTGVVVGACAFKGAPSPEGAVEIGYFTFANHEGKGCATAMARALIEIARAAPEVSRVIAFTLPQAGASPSILKRIGMTCLGEVADPIEGLAWRWEMDIHQV